MTRPAAALAAAVLVALVASGCETTQEQSALIARRLGHQSARTGTTRIAAANRSVRVLRAVVVPGSPAAVALELTNTGTAAQSAIPVLITVRDAKGAVVYRNDTQGIETSLQQFALLAPHATAWWVDNQVLTSGGVAATVSAIVGSARTGAGGAAALAVGGISASDSFPGPHVDVTVHNSGTAVRAQVAVYAIATKAGRVVGAGRAIVATLPAGASAPAEIPMTGAVGGATIAVTAAG